MPFPGLKTANERKDVIAYMIAGTSPAVTPAAAQRAQPPAAAPAQPAASAGQPAVAYVPDARYTLRSGIAEGRMVYLGVGGTIDGQINPVLSAAEGQTVQIILINGEGAEHDIVFPDQGAKSPRIFGRGASTTIAFRATRAGDFTYICSVPGHELAGMRGQFIVTPRPPAQTLVEADISQKATEVPAPIGNRPPQTVRVDLNAVELEGRLAEGTTFGYWTFNGRVPGPMLRVRVGDTVDVRVKNSADSTMIHSVDFHAATGPGGGAAATQVDPGGEKSFKFKALIPGLYVYHCATPMVAHHIANGMYGLILVEPEGGLPPVDREFYVMQGEIYTEAPFGQRGSQEFSVEKLLNERPEYFVFNGSVGALSKLHPLEAKVGETVRIFFGVGGPNFTSSFHVIGEIFDRVYNLGGVLSEPLRGVQTVYGSGGRRRHHGVQGRCARQLHPGRSRPLARRARPGRHPACRGPAQSGNFRRQGRARRRPLTQANVRACGVGRAHLYQKQSPHGSDPASAVPIPGPALLSYGFRPFFLFGGCYAALTIMIWLPLFYGELVLPTTFSPRDWHVHEMLYGYIPAVVTGFLLTSIPNWTGRLPLQGGPLLILVIAWAAGRVAVTLVGRDRLARGGSDRFELSAFSRRRDRT